MKKILLGCLLIIAICNAPFAQVLNTSTYRLLLDEEFNYTPATFKSSGSPFLDRWHILNCYDQRTSDGIWDEARVNMPTTGVLELTDSIVFLPLSSVACPPFATDTAFHMTGGVWLKDVIGPFGIMEAKIKLRSHWTSFPSFYMDNAIVSILPLEANSGKWWQAAEDGFPAGIDPYTVSHGTCSYCDGFELTGEPHIFSVEWSPEKCTFYFDSIRIDLPQVYTDVRTFFNTVRLKFFLSTLFWESTLDTMDVYYVKIWTKDCQDTISVFDPVIAPGLYKALDIIDEPLVLGPVVTVPHVDPNSATVFEGSAIYLLPGFLADETVVPTHVFPEGTMVWGGYFEAVNINCQDTFGGHPRPDRQGGGEPRTGAYSSEENQYSQGIASIADDIAKTKDTYANRNAFSFLGANSSFSDNTAVIYPRDNATIQFDENLRGIQKMDIRPNPVSTYVTVLFPCPSAGTLEISITDVNGRTRYDETIECNTGGMIQRIVDMNGWVPGVYFINLTCNSVHVMKKIIKI